MLLKLVTIFLIGTCASSHFTEDNVDLLNLEAPKTSLNENHVETCWLNGKIFENKSFIGYFDNCYPNALNCTAIEPQVLSPEHNNIQCIDYNAPTRLEYSCSCTVFNRQQNCTSESDECYHTLLACQEVTLLTEAYTHFQQLSFSEKCVFVAKVLAPSILFFMLVRLFVCLNGPVYIRRCFINYRRRHRNRTVDDIKPVSMHELVAPGNPEEIETLA